MSTSAPHAAFAACSALAAAHYENFPVRAPFLPRRARDDLAAVYAFCRATDDLGDEHAGDGPAALEAWEEGVRRALAGEPPRESPFLAALAETAARRRLPSDLFLRLIEANRRDQTMDRYPDEAALIDYCRHSATPVGRMVLGIVGVDEPLDPEASGPLVQLADATSIGLQLANFWQDLARDWAQGRCYLPLDVCARHGVDPALELSRARASKALTGVVAEMVVWARDFLARGWPLAGHLTLRWRPLVRGFTRGGWAVCDAIAAQGGDTLTARPILSRRARRLILFREILRAPTRHPRLDGGAGRTRRR
ncbi:MAG TPA: squalene/phytoene synthase family protein [Gemmatimonadota bacterium]|nr:squalene/phytoene synthase family protein [Gemmatimonadota bacterium]